MNSTLTPGSSTEKIRTGQKLLIYAILLNIVSIAIRFAGQDSMLMIVSAVIALVAIVMSIMGIIRMARGLGHHWAVTVLFCILMVIPCISILVLLILNQKATKHLKTAGYRVGLLGAEPRA